MPWHEPVILFLAALLGGAVNAVAGGGTLLTFPALLWAGQSEIVANATSTVALWPGQLSSLWGYRSEIGRSGRAMACLAVPSLLGGALGAQLLLRTDNETFAALVPYLILLATLLFAAQEPLARWQRARAERAAGGEAPPSAEAAGISSATEERHAADPILPSGATPGSAPVLGRWLAVMAFQFLVAVYGGYFGAGIGILMLAAFGFLGLTNIHRMNALKNVNGLCINGLASLLFIVHGMVDWRLAGLMAAGAITGGYVGAGAALRIGRSNVRRLVVLIGLSLTVALLVRQVRQ
jgi:uncharacterized protein